jgi:hypothetical protein
LNGNILDREIEQAAHSYLAQLEGVLDSDVVFYYGEIRHGVERLFRDLIEDLAIDEGKRERLTVVLNTPGGSVETTEKLVLITRHHYQSVQYLVPDAAMSAGTIWAMSGDRILMDYTSSLGPVDPQVFNGQRFVPALNYLDKVAELIAKSRSGSLTDAEFLILRELDLAELRSFEQAKELTISLLEQWLVKYKFRTWLTHRSNPDKKDQPVTEEEKKTRAREIAEKLSDTSIWHSHGRAIDIHALRMELRLEIDDYSDKLELRNLVRKYSDLLTGYIGRMGFPMFFHSRRQF